jgi:hypothetical protein
MTKGSVCSFWGLEPRWNGNIIQTTSLGQNSSRGADVCSFAQEIRRPSLMLKSHILVVKLEPLGPS